MQDLPIDQRIRQLEDRSALKSLVDTFSNLADTKDIQKQVLLFTEDATVDSYFDGVCVSSLKGRKQIGDAFDAYLATFNTVYHINGQQTVELEQDHARGTSYCLVVLIGQDGGISVRTTSGVIYKDTYVRVDGSWLIQSRVSNFSWRARQRITAADT
ncbi:MAG: nuclear transport factor 2 family protein [Nevskia sp.]|nr:nuclear transport factor 2 family protein [Nevskia sp.]